MASSGEPGVADRWDADDWRPAGDIVPPINMLA